MKDVYKADSELCSVPAIFEFSDIGKTVLYWPVCYRLRRGGDFAVSVHIVEIANVRRNSNNVGLWEYITRDQNGDVLQSLSTPWLGDLPPIVNQFLWIDEPVGHSLQFGDDLFLTPQECCLHMKPSPKGGKQRLLRAYRNRFIHEKAESGGITVVEFKRRNPEMDYNRKRKSIHTRK